MNISKSLIICVVLTILGCKINAQSLTDVARSKELTWYGVDFTLVKFIGFSQAELFEKIPSGWTYTTFPDNANIQPAQLQEQYPPVPQSNLSSNTIRRYYGKKKLYDDGTETSKRNDSVLCRSRIVNNAYFLNIEGIRNVVREYKFKGSGYGVLLIVESIEKVSKGAFIWVVYINNSNGEIISSKRYNGFFKSVLFLNKAIKTIIKLSGKDLKNYKK